MENYISIELRGLLGNEVVIENNIELCNEILFTITFSKPIEIQQLRKTSLFFNDLLGRNKISRYATT